MTIEELERAITDARDRGDGTLTRELQEEYRRSAVLNRVTRGSDAIRLIEPSPTRALSGPVPTPQARRATVPLHVAFRGYAWEGVVDDDFRADEEVGWWLLGEQDEHEMRVWRVARAREDGHVGSSHEVSSDGQYAADIERVLEDGPRWRVLGHMHSHPHSEQLEPSTADLSGWAEWATKFRRPFAGVICGPGLDPVPFAAPLVQTWIVDERGVHRLSSLSIERQTP
jgi:hypothetical protein